MSFIALIVTIALVGLLVWAVTTYIPMPEGFKKLIYVVAIVVIGLWLLSVFGLMGELHTFRVGK